MDKTMKNIFSIITVFVFTFISLYSQNNQAKTIDARAIFNYSKEIRYNDKKSNDIQTIVAGEQVRNISLNKENLESLLQSNPKEITIKNYPVSPTENKNVSLHKTHTPFREGTLWLRVKNNNEQKAENIIPEFYVGNIIGVKGSKVSFFYFKGMLFSIIQRDGYDNYSISPINVNTNVKDAHILISQRSTAISENSNPFLEILPQKLNLGTEIEDLLKYSEHIQSNKLLQADIAIEVTNDFYRLYNNYDQVAAYVAAVMAEASQIYEENVNITLFVPNVIIYEDKLSDPYRNTTQLPDRLYQMPQVWKSRTFKRTMSCLFTDLSYQGGSGYYVAGISLGIGTICDNRYSYCVFGMHGHYKYPTSNYTWDVNVSSHEMGHAFGSPHTHSCYFKPNMIDTCITRNKPQANSDGCVRTGNPIPRPGTIMSYCHLTNKTHSVQLYFHDRVKPLIRGKSEESSCVKEAVDPTLILLQPSGGSVLFPNQEVKIRWAYNKVNNVAIKYSLDNEKTWIWINQNVPSNAKEFTWRVPDTITTNMKLYIQSNYDPSIKDSTSAALTIDRPQFELKNPVENSRLGQKEKYKIKWEQKYIDKIKIEFSSDNGNNWATVVTGINGSDYNWDIPNIESENCYLKLTANAQNDSTYIRNSGKFAIGKESCEILSPTPTEKICAGQTYTIKWKSDFVEKLYVQYSTNGGDNWRHVKFTYIDGSTGEYNWKVPNIITNYAIMRFAPYENKENILAVMDSPFIIDSCTSGINETQNENQNNLLITEIKPNPASETIIIKYKTKSDIGEAPLILFISNELGKTVIKNIFSNITYADNTLKISVRDLAQGTYYLTIKIGAYTDMKPLKIIK